VGVGAEVEANLGKVGNVLGLGEADRRVLLFFAVREVRPVLQDGLNLFRGQHRKEYIRKLARMLGESERAIRLSLAPDGPLMRSCVLRWERNSRNGHYVDLQMDALGELLLEPNFTLEKAIRTLATPAPASSLRYRDYPHLQGILGNLRPYLRAVLRKRHCGANFYLYGPPGTGKSELVRALAREMRAGLYEVSTEDGEGDPQSGARRLEALRGAQAFLQSRRALLVFDEAEDIFRGESVLSRSLASQRKGWMNRFFERNAVPTFWVSNSGRGLDPAFMRRFDFVFEVGNAPKNQRRRSYGKICGKEVPARTVHQLAECEALTPAVVARAHTVAGRIRSVKPSVRHEETLLQLVGETLKAQGHGSDALARPESPVPGHFDLASLNSNVPLAPIAEQLDPAASCRMCLYGPPGTGKTTFGHWLAQQLERPLCCKRVSDIVSPYLGETEQNLARIFRKAQEDREVLLIDEVDSFLQDRRQAHRSWEVSQVNELLTQMERFQGIFIASTNLVDGLDAASLRRFDLKISFGYLRGDQVRGLLERHCRELGLGRPGADVLARAEQLGNATPGDFANAARQHRFRRFGGPKAYWEAVESECRMKEGGARRPVGF
ncbi:MAG: ATP-binding protein, partial [Desulfohalobium sp.]